MTALLKRKCTFSKLRINGKQMLEYFLYLCAKGISHFAFQSTISIITSMSAAIKRKKME